MADNQIEFDVVAKLDGIDKQLAALEKKTEKTGKEVQDNLGSKIEKSVSGAFKSIAATAIAAGATILAGLAFKEVIKAAAEEQVAINNLNQSLANAGTFSEAASQDIQNFAAEIQRTTTIADDAALGMVALARNFARTNEEAVKLTQAAIELSAATGIGLEAAVEGLGKSLTGQAGRLAQQVPILRSFTEEQLKAGAAIDAVLNRFGGSAAAQVNTFSGAFTQLKNVFGDLQESLGNLVVNSPAVVAAFKFISQTIQTLIGELNKLGEGGADPFGQFLSKAIDVTNFLTSIFGPVLEFTIQLIVKTANAIGALAASFVQLITGEFKAAMATFNEGVLNELDLNSFTFAGTEAATKFLTGMSDAVKNAAPLTQEFKNNVNLAPVLEENIKSVNLFEQAFIASIKRTEEQSRISTTNIQKGFIQVRQAMFQNLVSGFQNAFSAIGAALVKGENVFAAFGKAILGMFGDIALQLGQFYLLLGIANLWLNPAAAAGQIAGGLALSVLGGALKALAGGGGGVAPTAAATGGGVNGGGFTATPGESAGAFQETEPTEPGTMIAVNIQGNVLGDKRTLGREIADALNEAFESDGAIIARGAIS